MSMGYAITNALSGLAATAFTWSSGYTTGRSYLNDGRQDEIAVGGTLQASGQTLTVDLGSATAIVGVALLGHNLASGSSAVAVSYADDSGFTTGTGTAKSATTINTSAPYNRDSVLQFPSATKRYWRLTFTHSGSKTLQLGELLFFTSITTLSRSPVYGSGESERYAQNRVETMTGQQRATFLAGPIRTKRLPFKDLRATAERDELMTMWRATKGGVSNLLLIDSIDSSASAGSAVSQQCLWGKLQTEMSWTEGDYSLFDVDALVLVGQGREAGS